MSAAGRVEVEAHLLLDDGLSPNNARFPLLVYRNAIPLPARDPAAAFEVLFEANGWGGSWRNGVFPYHHFHSNAHEVLGVFTGEATVRFGGEGGITADVGPGDVIVIPAGVAHKGLSTRSGFGCVGAYPNGQRPDLCRGDGEDHEARQARVAAVVRPSADPVFGPDGPLASHWR